MKVTKFIDRPLLSIVISVIIVTVGVISLLTLPIEKYPDIAPPTINVSASYPGASADAVQKAVVAPLEEAINGVENMTYMTSQSSNGNASITIYFAQGTNADMASVNVQNRVTLAQSTLPQEVIRLGVTTQKQQPGQLRTIALESPNGTYDQTFLSNYFYNNIRQKILRIQGVGQVQVFGAQYALRIWLRPDAMAARHLVPSDITQVLNEQNLEASIGALGDNSDNVYQYVLRYTGRKASVEEFENLVITSQTTGEELLLKDVADLELGLNDYGFRNQVNGRNGVVGMISQTSGSNATKINLEIDDLFEQLEKELPKDIRLVTFDNTNDFLFASIHEVVLTLIIAILLVLLVVYFFLQDFRATLVPAVGIIVSLIGTFAFMQIAGFSINLLTLFSLVLVIGTVVDDSIVVVEAVQARFDAGYKNSIHAAKDAMEGLTSALFTTSLVFMVIFVPVSFMGGTTGIFYKQFGLTMAVAVGISFINAITLSSTLCALLLKPIDESKRGLAYRVRTAYNVTYHAMLGKYTKITMQFIRRKWLVGAGIAAAVAILVVLMKIVPTGFVPDEDTGAVNVDIATPAGYTQEKTEKILTRISNQINEIPAVSDVGSVVGFAFTGVGSNHGMCFVQLKPWDQREGQSVDDVLVKINEILANEHEARAMAIKPGMIDGYGNGGGFEISLTNKNGKDIHTFFQVSEDFIGKLCQRPEIMAAYSGYDVNYPQYAVDVDASRCKKMGVSPASVLSELSAYMGSAYVSNFNLFNKVYQVTMQLRPEDRARMEQLDQVFIRSEKGEMMPVSQFITLRKEFRPQVLNSFNMEGSIGVTGMLPPGGSSGDAIQAIREEAEQHLPAGYEVEFSGITREESSSSSNVMLIFAISIFFVYLVMVALYESLFIPLAVMLSVPFCLAGSFLFAMLFGVENNIYLQVGLIMLIGLLCKTAILLTEYATQCRQAGMSLKQAAFFSAKMRLRPILMTSLTMVFGMLPLMFATGVGANGSRTIGVGTVGGMLIGTLGLLFITPALFVIFQAIQEKIKPIKEFIPSDDPLIQHELELIAEYTENKKKKNS
ncbi:MAG: efflux RND transporter permease subunit [Bacteroidales bacterium]|nr:efflux RND transporter permease subunit [Bacteroidales bacterium]